jgi:hypothetical protein
LKSVRRYLSGLQSEIDKHKSAIEVTPVTFPNSAASRYLIPMSTGTSHAKYRCAQCEMPEAQCECDKFCCLCQTQLDIRICADGLMYCEPCRRACDYKTSD